MIIGGRLLKSKYSGMVTPFREQYKFAGMTGGLGPAGYDIALDLEGRSHIEIKAGGFLLAGTVERFKMPDDIMGIVHDKSTLARQGITVQNTVIEPGWEGFLTLEITNHSDNECILLVEQPIAQVVFHQVIGGFRYEGKYQNQERGPQGPK